MAEEPQRRLLKAGTFAPWHPPPRRDDEGVKGSRLGLAVIGAIGVFAFAWMAWGAIEMYYEGWWGPWWQRAFYLVPGVVFVLLGVVAALWPRAGGAVLMIIGAVYTVFVLAIQIGRGATIGVRFLLGWFPVTGAIVLLGAGLMRFGPAVPPARRRWAAVAVAGGAMAITVAVSAMWIPRLASRLDDGDRGERRIVGAGIDLIWAPAGPGWNQVEPDDWMSWDELAWWGADPMPTRHATGDDMELFGLCRYLSADGTELQDRPAGAWRMPTTDEVVGSLVRDGSPVGCTWDGVSASASCPTEPDKETPLWAPDEAPIYYWTADEFDVDEAWYVNYSGSIVAHQPKDWGNPRHGYRCVREP